VTAIRAESRRGSRLRPQPLPGDLVLTPLSRRPTRLEKATLRTLLGRRVPRLYPEPSEQPWVSIVVVTRENQPFLRLCLESVLVATEASFELIVVDNGSSDGTPAYLARLAERNANVHVIANAVNCGFAAATNQGAGTAAGELLVLLNDDTAVGPGWLARLIAHLDDPDVGMVGPTTNRIGNEAQVDADYRTWAEFLRFADARARRHAGEAFEIPTLTMFCLAMRRSLYEEVGPLDERFEIGLLEDDDYSRRVREARYRLLCVEDVFVHHFGETSFGRLVASGEYAEVLEANRVRFEDKWGEPWEPYARRQSDRYRELVERVQQAVAAAVPAGATTLIVSRGDDELLRVEGRRTAHFPRSEGGAYAGHYPGSGDEAVELLEAERAAGAEYLVFPATGAWWLEYYDQLQQHLDDRYRSTFSDPESCFIFDLREPPQ